MKTKWLRIDEITPAEEQNVWYWFGLFDKIYAGRYIGADECSDNIFIDKGGWLSDEVTYWMPRNEGDIEPEYPSKEEKGKCLYNPIKEVTC